MIKVIGHDQAVAKHATCKNCGAINEYLPADVKGLYRGRDMSGCGEGSDGFNCADCREEIIIRSW
jgi:hypothetical protein